MRTVDLILYIVAVAALALLVLDGPAKWAARAFRGVNLLAVALLAWLLIEAIPFFRSY